MGTGRDPVCLELREKRGLAIGEGGKGRAGLNSENLPSHGHGLFILLFKTHKNDF